MELVRASPEARRDIARDLASIAESGNAILEAYPGFGKTMIASEIASNASSAAVITRTVEEMFEVIRFSQAKIIPLYGKEKLCLIWDGSGDVYRFCWGKRILNMCGYEYRATNDLVRWVAGAPRKPEEIRDRGKKAGLCPYPSVQILSKSRRIVTTYGYAFTHTEILDRDLVIFDESHELLEAVLQNVEVIDDSYIELVFRSLKKDLEARQAAYMVRGCWRRATSFPSFVECLERFEGGGEEIDGIINAHRRGRSYWQGKEGWILRRMPSFREKGLIFITAYLPPYIINMIPRHKVIKMEDPERVIEAEIDTSLTSRFEERGEEIYRGYAEKIVEYYDRDIATLVMLPSYQFLEEVRKRLPSTLLDRLKPPEAVRDLVAGDIVLDVAGGRSTEGVNPSPYLGRVIVAGLPYPPPTGGMNLLAKIYGFDSTYTYTALLRVVQAVGRLRFRKGARAILIDRRFEGVRYLMPSWIKIS